MKDNFSTQSDLYARYRPGYPSQLFEFLMAHVPGRAAAWDCGTGNGQVARELAQHFEQVLATDISQQQLDHAFVADNISYSLQPAEKTNFRAASFDLIVVGQAIHWFDFGKFYAEVRRTAKQKGLLCVVGYGRLQISEPLDRILDNFYYNTVGAYWDKERKYIDENYTSIPFPFEELQTPAMANTQVWTLEELTGYLSTWSAVKHFMRQNGHNPVDTLKDALALHWGGVERRQISFPLLVRVGRVHED